MPGSVAVVSAALISGGSKSFCTTSSPSPQVNLSTAPRTVTPLAAALWPALKMSDLGNPTLFWKTAPGGSSSNTWAQVMPPGPQVTTVLDWQNQPVAPVALPSMVSTVVQLFSGIAVCT